MTSKQATAGDTMVTCDECGYQEILKRSQTNYTGNGESMQNWITVSTWEKGYRHLCSTRCLKRYAGKVQP